MAREEIGRYWLEESEDAIKVAKHLAEKCDYSYLLFFGHLSVKKLHNAFYVLENKEHVPPRHNLIRFAEFTKLNFPPNYLLK